MIPCLVNRNVRLRCDDSGRPYFKSAKYVDPRRSHAIRLLVTQTTTNFPSPICASMVTGRNSEMSLPRYEELLLPSKFFYTDGHEAASFNFLDETKVDPQVEVKSRHESDCSSCEQNPPSMSDDFCEFPTIAALDIECALDAACEDSKFLVICSPLCSLCDNHSTLFRRLN